MTFIFSIEGEPTISERAKRLLNAPRNHPGVGITSELSLAEVLAGSKDGLSPPVKRAYLDLMVWSNFLDLVPIRLRLIATASMKP
jgi:hypothetical protein